MSQTSFLESVVTWNETQCRENLQEALPKLINQLAETNVSEEELGICKIICELFLPLVKFQDVEKMVFIHITAKTCSIMDKVLDGISELCRQTSVQTDIHSLLEMFVEVLDCYSACFKYVQVEGGNSPNICDVHSLPYGAVHLLKGAYSHCKESGNIYGDFLPGVTELLSALFKKAHGLQMALLSMLEKISVDGQVTEDEAQDLCFICQGLFEVCQTVTSLDAKLVCSLWKTISRFSGRHSNHVRNDLDVDRMVIFLCEEIKSGYLYLFQLAPTMVESTEMSLSQGDSAAFQKSLKVLSYQMRIMISVLENFVDYVHQCEQNVFQLIICIYRNLPPCLEAPNVSEVYIAEIQRQIVNGTEPLLNLLVRKQHFMECVTSDEKDLLSMEDHFPFLLMLIKIVDLLPKQSENIIDKWMSPKLYTGDVQRDGLLDCMFKAVENCYVEMSLLGPDAVTVTTDRNRSTSLYEYACTHVCGLIGSLRARHFAMLEHCLMGHLFSQNIYVSTLVMDVWCFMARFGSADLCLKHTELLLELCKRPELQYVEFNLPIYSLACRLMKFVAPEHHVKLLKKFPVEQNPCLYRMIPGSVLHEQYRDTVRDKVVNMFTASVQQILTKEDATLEHVECLVYILQSLNNCLSGTDLQVEISSQNGATLGRCVEQLLAIWNKDWLQIPMLKICFAELLQTFGFCLQFVTADVINDVVDLLSDTVKSTPCDSHIKSAAVQFLITCRKYRFPPNSQSQVLRKIPKLFQKLIQDKDVLVHQCAIEAFTQFAESTPHEDIVPMCLENSLELQDAVVSFLNKKPYFANKLGQREFLKGQQMTIRENRNVVSDLDGETRTIKAGDGQMVKGSCKTGDMLDDITCGEEPSLKRKRLTDYQEKATRADDIIDHMEKNLDDLETVSRASLTSQNVRKLRGLHTRLKTFLDS